MAPPTAPAHPAARAKLVSAPRQPSPAHAESLWPQIALELGQRRRRHHAQPALPLYELSATSRTGRYVLKMHEHRIPLPTGTHPSIGHMHLVTACMSGSVQNKRYLACAANLLAACSWDIVVWVDYANVLELAKAAEHRFGRTHQPNGPVVHAGTTIIIVPSCYELPLTRDLGGWRWARLQPRLSKFWARTYPGRVMDYSFAGSAAFATWISKPSMLIDGIGPLPCDRALLTSRYLQWPAR